MLDTIYSSSNFLRDIATYHGGQRIDVARRNASEVPVDSISLYYSSTGRAPQALGPSTDYTLTGSTRSTDQRLALISGVYYDSSTDRSHNGDSTAHFNRARYLGEFHGPHSSRREGHGTCATHSRAGDSHKSRL